MAGAAAKANLLPGLLLQCLMVIFFSLYIAHEGTKQFLGEVATMKEEAGYAFSFFSYVIAGALLPELLRIGFFQAGRATKRNFWLFLTAVPLWGTMGVLVDLLYRLQSVWFGPGNGWETIFYKVLADQLLFSPFISAPLIVGWLFLRDHGFRSSAWNQIFCVNFVFEKVFPVVVAGWCVWVPGVVLVYFMPPLLQIPIAVFIQVFWVLIITTMEESPRRKPLNASLRAGQADPQPDQSRKF